jgi:hypothetical protein
MNGWVCSRCRTQAESVVSAIVTKSIPTHSRNNPLALIFFSSTAALVPANLDSLKGALET